MENTLTLIEQHILYNQVLDYAIQFVFNLRKMSIHIPHDWINDITIDDSYEYLYELLVLYTDREIVIMKHL